MLFDAGGIIYLQSYRYLNKEILYLILFPPLISYPVKPVLTTTCTKRAPVNYGR